MPIDDVPPQPPTILRRLSNDEFVAPPLDELQRKATSAVIARGSDDAKRVARPMGDYWSSRLGTAAGLIELNRATGVRYFEVPDEARLDIAHANAALGGDELVIDVQTHYLAARPELRPTAAHLMELYRSWQPSWWSGLKQDTSYGLAEFLRCVYVESETAVAVLTAPPATEDGDLFLTNDELAGTRELIERFAGTGRLLNHTVIHPTDPGALESMENHRDRLRPAGWKVYTMGHLQSRRGGMPSSSGSVWMLDDEEYGIPFLERVRELGGANVCSHKGLSGEVDNGSPRDIGPSARAFPDLRFIVYHSGYEPSGPPEGPYTDQSANVGVNRLIKSLLDSGLGPGENVYAELGSTWFCLIKRPLEAAHVMGKLLKFFGEDNILWGTDSTWYGPTQPSIDAFRTFVIPQHLCDSYGYPQLTAQAKEKILGLNAAVVYDLDVATVRESARRDDLAWTRAATLEARGLNSV